MLNKMSTYNQVTNILQSAGARNIKISLPKINPTTGDRYGVFGVWYTNKYGNNKVLIVPDADWEDIPQESKNTIEQLAGEK